MRYESIADIYSANHKIRKHFLAVVDGVADHEAAIVPDGETWSIRQIVEHVSIVNSGMSRICRRLVAAAGQTEEVSNGTFSLNAVLKGHLDAMETRKAEAPERVLPTGNIPIPVSLKNLEDASEAFASLKAGMETFDLTGHTFPHPYFGELTASEWLVVCGLHEARHAQQIERVLDAVRA